ncbi:MAG TPA: cytochrome c [Bacteroidia bacterium]|nr:cytochrome c [Bacteroidota bacterium]HRC32596.1 cytochrome c [Bacteroidia bacterium]
MMFLKNRNKIAIIGFVAVLTGLGSCRDAVKFPGYEYFPEMYRGPAYETYAPSTIFADSLSSLKPVAGSVSRGFMPFNYSADNAGYEKASLEAFNPLRNDSINLGEGKRLYEIYCVNCHGAEGMGDGNLVADNKFPGVPPSYSTGTSSRGGTMKDLTDGKIYHTITHGINLMGAHSGQLNPQQRWQITMYVRDLQKIGQATAAPAADSTAAAIK